MAGERGGEFLGFDLGEQAVGYVVDHLFAGVSDVGGEVLDGFYAGAEGLAEVVGFDRGEHGHVLGEGFLGEVVEDR